MAALYGKLQSNGGEDEPDTIDAAKAFAEGGQMLTFTSEEFAKLPGHYTSKGEHTSIEAEGGRLRVHVITGDE